MAISSANKIDIGKFIVMSIIINFGNFWEMLSAIGTVGAVVISLWLSSRNERPQLYIHYCIECADEGVPETYIFEIINIGRVPTTLLYEGISMHSRNHFNTEVGFDGIINWSHNDKNWPTSYANTLRPGESVVLEVEEEVMKKTIHNLTGKKNKKKLYFYIVDSTNRRHFVEFSVEDIME